ncbi:MAG TPA: hypothetical protein VFT84_07435 [Gemmatimonadales bacterium]|nr:hypothetical protein [Gemmatimonadales bacterium]
MPPDPLSEALAGLYIMSDNGIKRSNPKLVTGVGPGDPEGFYLLATICFDLVRRFYYLTEMTAVFRDSANAELRDRILQENDYIQGTDQDTWQTRAQRAEELLLRYAGGQAAKEHERWMRGGGAATAS